MVNKAKLSVERRAEDQYKDLIKEAMRESINDWADKKYKAIGKFTVGAVGVFVLVVLVHLLIMTHSAQLKSMFSTYLDQWSH